MSKGRLTRENILTTAFQLASENGLESLTIGALAKQCGMSKSGLFAHFNSKENLQVSVLQFADQVFRQRVIMPAREMGSQDIEAKLRALLDNWMGWNHAFQGSCMFLDAWKERVDSDDVAQQALHAMISHWIHYLQIQIEKGIANGQFCKQLQPDQAAFELYGLYLSAHLFYTIKGQQVSERYFWQGVERLLQSWRALT
ncbi:TetR/AcrR family transcriptional regulator [Vibrio sp.]|uniref:TetR/AcrR family transcriptional regulator n=1 Tax=Vibrio sp. TaxID=678 RepID=UPI003D09C1A0